MSYLPTQIYPILQDKANHYDRTATPSWDRERGPGWGTPPLRSLQQEGNAEAKRAVGAGRLRDRGRMQRWACANEGSQEVISGRKPCFKRKDVNVPPSGKVSDFTCTSQGCLVQAEAC